MGTVIRKFEFYYNKAFLKTFYNAGRKLFALCNNTVPSTLRTPDTLPNGFPLFLKVAI